MSLLKLVEGQPTNDWGAEWRQRAKAHHERIAARRAALNPGALVTYGGRLYRLEARWHTGTDWRVAHMQDLGGRLVPTQAYRMRLSQLLKSEPYNPGSN